MRLQLAACAPLFAPPRTFSEHPEFQEALAFALRHVASLGARCVSPVRVTAEKLLEFNDRRSVAEGRPVQPRAAAAVTTRTPQSSPALSLSTGPSHDAVPSLVSHAHPASSEPASALDSARSVDAEAEERARKYAAAPSCSRSPCGWTPTGCPWWCLNRRSSRRRFRRCCRRTSCLRVRGGEGGERGGDSAAEHRSTAGSGCCFLTLEYVINSSLV